MSGISATTGLRIFSTGGEYFFHTADGYELIWEDPDAYGYAFVMLVYANNAGTIRGIAMFEDEYYGESQVITVNMELRPGWNTAILTVEPDPVVSGRWNTTMVTGRPGNNFRWGLW